MISTHLILATKCFWKQFHWAGLHGCKQWLAIVKNSQCSLKCVKYIDNLLVFQAKIIKIQQSCKFRFRRHMKTFELYQDWHIDINVICNVSLFARNFPLIEFKMFFFFSHAAEVLGQVIYKIHWLHKWWLNKNNNYSFL